MSLPVTPKLLQLFIDCDFHIVVSSEFASSKAERGSPGSCYQSQILSSLSAIRQSATSQPALLSDRQQFDAEVNVRERLKHLQITTLISVVFTRCYQFFPACARGSPDQPIPHIS